MTKIRRPTFPEFTPRVSVNTNITDSSVFAREQNRQDEMNQQLVSQQGSENPIRIWKELGDLMTEHVTVTRVNKDLEMTHAKNQELQARYKKMNLSDRTQWSNQTLTFARELGNMLILARVITAGALCRNESRGAHYKPEFPERDDSKWLKTTRAKWVSNDIKLTYEPVDISLIPPRARRYDAAK